MADRGKVLKGLEICTSRPCYCTDCPYKKECCLDSQNLMEDALALLKEQEPTVSGWVSVKDRPPEKSGWYQVSLVNTRTGHRWEVPVPADYSHGEWNYAYLGGDDATWTLTNTVTHWMPLPEPPKEDDA